MPAPRRRTPVACSAATAAVPLPAFDHVVVIVFENKEATSVLGNRAAPTAHLVPFFVGFTVAALISLFAPLTQAGWNPARDLGSGLVLHRQPQRVAHGAPLPIPVGTP